MGGGSLHFMQQKRGHQKFKQGFGEGHIFVCKHCCSLKIKINK